MMSFISFGVLCVSKFTSGTLQCVAESTISERCPGRERRAGNSTRYRTRD
jgi:hypothetical protein